MYAARDARVPLLQPFHDFLVDFVVRLLRSHCLIQHYGAATFGLHDKNGLTNRAVQFFGRIQVNGTNKIGHRDKHTQSKCSESTLLG